jgi:hypothetical protein
MAILAIFYLAYRLGREEGKWGPFAVLVGILIIGSIGAKCSG